MTSSTGRHRRAWRAIALLLIVTGWGVPLAFPHVADDDLLCALAAAGRGEARVIQASASAQAEHCEVCHSLRTFRHAGLPAGIASINLTVAHAAAPDLNAPTDRLSSQRLPARAPPA